MSFSFGRASGIIAGLALTSLLFSPAFVSAQDSEHEWQKQYPLSAEPSLVIEMGDSSLNIRSCGECKEIRVHVHSTRKLSEYRLEEHQDQNHVYFTLKEKPHPFGFQIHWKSSDEPQVSVETPAKLTLEAKTSDGGVEAHHLNGSLQIHSGDGSVLLDDVHGELHLTSSDGNLTIHDAGGTLDARTSDGGLRVDGQFSAVQLHTSDGQLDFMLNPGSKLTSASRIESSDGEVSIRVPRNLAADLDVSTSDGRVDCDLPLTLNGYNSSQAEHHQLRGKLNEGGTQLSIHTSDGNVRITAI